MGAQWKQVGREANAQKKGQMVVKLVREITVAAKLGGADPELNARLAAAVEKAKKASVYRDTIERAIKKGAGLTDEVVNYETVVYEGFAPHKVPVVVECLTDNRNRTAPEIRNLFKAGSLGQPGSVAFFFLHLHNQPDFFFFPLIENRTIQFGKPITIVKTKVNRVNTIGYAGSKTTNILLFPAFIFPD